MGKKEAGRQSYSLPKVSDLEQGIAREYKKGFASVPSILEGFGPYLFPLRIPSEDLKDSHESRGATDVYDEALLEVYALGLAKAQIAASKATEDAASSVLDRILGETDDFFLNELQKRDKWQKYLSPACVTGWYDDKRRAALRGFAKKGISLQGKVEETSAAAPVQGRSRFLSAFTLANTVLLALLGAYAVLGTFYGISFFKKETQSIREDIDTKERKYLYQVYDFADQIDPPKDDKEKAEERKLSPQVRLGQAIRAYEESFMNRAEKRLEKRQSMTEADALLLARIFIREIESGRLNIDLEQLLIKMFTARKKDENK